MKIYKTIIDEFCWGTYFIRIHTEIVLGKDALEFNFYNYRQISSREHMTSPVILIGDL